MTLFQAGAALAGFYLYALVSGSLAGASGNVPLIAGTIFINIILGLGLSALISRAK